MSEQDSGREWEALGSRLREVREYLNLSQVDVAAATGIPRSAVSDIERGRRKVDSLELRKLARLYRHPVSYLLGEEDDDAEPATAIGRAVAGLTDDDRHELMRFAQYLRYSAQHQTRRAQP